MTTITQVLSQILQYLEKHRPETAAALNPGLSYEEIYEQVKHLPFHLPQEIYELYQWRNGIQIETEIPDSEYLIPHFYFLSLEEAILECDETESFRLECGNQTQEDNSHKPWFPIFGIDDLEYLIVFGDEEEQQQSSPVLHCHLGGGAFPEEKYPNLASFIRVIEKAYETGAYYLDKGEEFYTKSHSHGYLMEDDEKLSAIELEVLGDTDLQECLELLHHKPITLTAMTTIEKIIGRYKDSRALAPLSRLLTVPLSEVEDPDENTSIRFTAAILMGKIGHQDAVIPLIEALEQQLLSERNWNVMCYIAKSLGQLGDPQAIEPIQRLVDCCDVKNPTGKINQLAEELHTDMVNEADDIALSTSRTTQFYGQVFDTIFDALPTPESWGKIYALEAAELALATLTKG